MVNVMSLGANLKYFNIMMTPFSSPSLDVLALFLYIPRHICDIAPVFLYGFIVL